MARIYFTVTNDLVYDQRMQRICDSLAQSGHLVTLIGRKTKKSPPIIKASYQQKRFNCWFNKGFLFYAEFNFRLFFYLLFSRLDAICAIDLDTILPCLWVSKLRRKKRIYDAHELFCEMKEVASRPSVHRFWKRIEKYAVPQFQHAYTVNTHLAETFEVMYGVKFEVIRSIARLMPLEPVEREKIILYQGAVNEGRCFEDLIPAMKLVDAKLVICGDGNFTNSAKQITTDEGLEDKVVFKGMVNPNQLRQYTTRAYIGITLFEKESGNNYYSLANRFFDYMHAGTPQLCMNYPAYAELNQKYPFAVLINDHQPQTIATHLNQLLNNETEWQQLHEGALKTRTNLNWQKEEKKLLSFYHIIFE